MVPRHVSQEICHLLWAEKLPRWLSGKESSCQYRRHRSCVFDPWVGRSPGEEIATHSSVTAWRSPCREETWQAAAQRVIQSSTSQTWAEKQPQVLGAWGQSTASPFPFPFFKKLSYSLHRALDLELPVSSEGVCHTTGSGASHTAARQATAELYSGSSLYTFRLCGFLEGGSWQHIGLYHSGTNTWTLCWGHPLKGQVRGLVAQRTGMGWLSWAVTLVAETQIQAQAAQGGPPSLLLEGGCLVSRYPSYPQGLQPRSEAV